MAVSATFYVRFGKRGCDVIASSVALIVLLPVMLALAFVIWVVDGRPVLYWQMRPGLGSRPFLLAKFRTMTSVFSDTGEALADCMRLTRLGRILRASSLDELPEFWNVLKGDMSLVGPRPLLMHYLPRYNARQSRRHDVRPGLTGLAQISGRNLLSWPKRLDLDVQYVEQVGFWLDVRILLWTAWAVLARRGVTQPGRATMDEFTGEEHP